MIKAIAAIRYGDGALGYKNKLIYSDKGDMERFKQLTLKSDVLLMGSNTAKSLGRPLHGRHCVVCTTSPGKQKVLYDKGFDIVSGKFIQELLDEYKGRKDKDLMVIGGGMLYNSLLPQIELFHLTIMGEPNGQLYKTINRSRADSFLDLFFTDQANWKLDWSGISLTNKEVIYYDYSRLTDLNGKVKA